MARAADAIANYWSIAPLRGSVLLLDVAAFAEGGGVKLPSATHFVVGFQHEPDARRFEDPMRERLQEYAIVLIRRRPA